MSHSNPNKANIPSVIYKIKSTQDELKATYNNPMREMWTVPQGNALIGTDADGIQLRILAHYMGDEVFTTALVSGKKEDGTDAHSLNAAALGNDIARDTAKTYIYAWILGAANAKQADILQKSSQYATQAEKNFLDKYPSLHYIKKELIPRDARRGYFEGIDGRKVICDSEHLMLAGYLQNAEVVIMKKANLLWLDECKKLQIPTRQVNFVHDEWQTQVRDDPKIIEKVVEVQCQSIVDAGEYYELKCPLAGTSNVGYNWKETH